MLVFIPNARFTNIVINSIFLPIILASTYGYLIYLEFYAGGMFAADAGAKVIENFKLYLGLDQLASL